MIEVTFLHPRAEDLIGFIPQFLSARDPRPAAEQFAETYAHGGGWSPMSGWKHSQLPNGQLSIQYPGDPAYHPVALIELRDEKIWIYQHAWVAIESARGVEISRMD